MTEFAQRMERVEAELRSLKREMYGNPETRQEGLYDKIDELEREVTALRGEYQAERSALASIDGLNTSVAALQVDYRIMLMQLRGISWAVGAILVTVIASAIVGAITWLSGA